MARVAGNSGTEPIGLRTTALLSLAAASATISAVLFHPAIAYPVAGLALATLVYGRRSAVAIATCLGTGVLAGLSAYAVYPVIVVPLVSVPLTARTPFVLGVLTVCSLLIVGPGAAVLMQRRPALQSAAAITAGLSIVQVVALAALAQGAGLTLQAYVAEAISGMAAQADGLAEAEEAIAALWPSITVALNGLTAVLVTAGVGLVAVRRKVEAHRFPAVATIDLDPWFVVPGIVALALIAAGRLSIEIAPALDVIGRNLLVVVRWVFFLQGVAVFAGLYERAKFGRATRMLGYLLLGVTEMLIPLVSITGLADIWLNIRRLPREKRPDEAVEAPVDTD